jgi:hypothetical protein
VTVDEARVQWRGGAAGGPCAGKCGRCGRVRDDTGRWLLIARRERERVFEFFACYALRAA